MNNQQQVQMEAAPAANYHQAETPNAERRLTVYKIVSPIDMPHERIAKGDWLYLETKRRPERGQLIAAMLLCGELVIGRVQNVSSAFYTLDKDCLGTDLAPGDTTVALIKTDLLWIYRITQAVTLYR